MEGKGGLPAGLHAVQLDSPALRPTVPPGQWTTMNPIPDNPATPPSRRGGLAMDSIAQIATCQNRLTDGRLARGGLVTNPGEDAPSERSARSSPASPPGRRLYRDTRSAIGCKCLRGRPAKQRGNSSPSMDSEVRQYLRQQTETLSGHVLAACQVHSRQSPAGRSRQRSDPGEPRPARNKCHPGGDASTGAGTGRWLPLMKRRLARHCAARPCQPRAVRPAGGGPSL